MALRVNRIGIKTSRLAKASEEVKVVKIYGVIVI